MSQTFGPLSAKIAIDEPASNHNNTPNKFFQRTANINIARIEQKKFLLNHQKKLNGKTEKEHKKKKMKKKTRKKAKNYVKKPIFQSMLIAD